MENGNDRDLGRFSDVIDAKRKSIHDRFSNVAVDNGMKFGVCGDEKEDAINLIHKLVAKSRPLSFVILSRVDQFIFGFLPKYERQTHD